MAEPVSNINDAGSPVTGAERVNIAEEPLSLPGTPPGDRLLPAGDQTGRSNPRLNAAAERVGGAVGNAVGSMRRARLSIVGGRDRRAAALGEVADPSGRMSDLAESTSATLSELKESASGKVGELKDRASELTQRASERISDLGQRVGDRAGELKDTAGERMTDLADSARERLYYVRRRANHLTHEYPVQTILGFAGLAFVIGFALRVWRSNGD